MSNEANALLQKLLVSRVDAAGAHCGRAPDDEPERGRAPDDEPERNEPEPDDE